jgi:hypothetical protein
MYFTNPTMAIDEWAAAEFEFHPSVVGNFAFMTIS